MKHIVIKRPNNQAQLVRSALESPSDGELTIHEQIINELHKENKELKERLNQLGSVGFDE